MLKKEIITLRVTDQQKQQLKKLSEEAELTLTEYILLKSLNLQIIDNKEKTYTIKYMPKKKKTLKGDD